MLGRSSGHLEETKAHFAYFEEATQLQYPDSEKTDSVAASGSSLESVNMCQALARAENLQDGGDVRRQLPQILTGRDAQKLGILDLVLDISTRTYYP